MNKVIFAGHLSWEEVREIKSFHSENLCGIIHEYANTKSGILEIVNDAFATKVTITFWRRKQK